MDAYVCLRLHVIVNTFFRTYTRCLCSLLNCGMVVVTGLLVVASVRRVQTHNPLNIHVRRVNGTFMANSEFLLLSCYHLRDPINVKSESFVFCFFATVCVCVEIRKLYQQRTYIHSAGVSCSFFGFHSFFFAIVICPHKREE